MFGASISCTRGVYAAELQAIARALAMFPTSCELEIHSDSQGALAGIHAYESQCNDRRRLRMAARPLLRLIHHLLQQRKAATHTSHVKAHTAGADIHSVGNRLTDYQANLARAKPDQPTPLSLRELPLSACEHHMFITDEQDQLLCDDIRRAALVRLQHTSMVKWAARADDRSYLAGPGMLELVSQTQCHGSTVAQATLVHVATNSIHFFWPAAGGPGDKDSALQRLRCDHCNASFDLAHLAQCPVRCSVQFRNRLAADVRSILSADLRTQKWLATHSACSLADLLLALFPIVATAPAQERLRHLTCLLVGAFTRGQASAAAKRTGFPSADEGRASFLALRLLCLESIHKAFRSWKEAAGA